MKKRPQLLNLLILAIVLALLGPYGTCLAEAGGPSYWAAEEISRARTLGLIPDSLQSMYENAITREEFALLLRQTLCAIDPSLQDPASNAESFTDTDSEAVLFCAGLGIIDGYGDGSFRPHLEIDRQAAAKMLYMAASSLGRVSASSDWLHIFADSRDISLWASSFVQWVQQTGIMKGTDENAFLPLSSITREQAILTVLRLYDFLAGTPGQPAAADRTISCNDGSIYIHNRADKLPGGTLHTRRYDIYNGDYVTMGSYVNDGENSDTALVARFNTGINSGHIKYYDYTNDKWIHTELKPGSYKASMINIISDSANYIFYTPRAWKIHENYTLEEIRNYNGFLYVHKGPYGFIVELYAYNLPVGYRSDFTCVSSRVSLIDWDYGDQESLWKNYTLDGKTKWCFDGYYHPSPSTYIPSGANYYYRQPSAYLLRSFLGIQSIHRAALDMSLCMLDTMAMQQNSEGFFPTMPGSAWLRDDYKIGPGFYDTRFNSDLMENMITGYEYYGGDRYYEVLQKYADFFLKYADEHHYTTPSGGWYVEDYYHPSGNHKRTHTALNHQLAEIIVLYRLSDVLSRDDLSGLADRMLLAVEDSGEKWLKSDNDLHYAYNPDGTYGLKDYPELTYNDMFNLQKLLVKRTGKTNDTLTMLMEHKKRWMDANGVTTYLK